jgi:molybdopterin molybdotransferase
MLGRGEALGAGDALEQILANTPESPVAVERILLEESFGRVLAQDVESPEDLPGFAKSTMDGYAIKASDSFGASETGPLYLNLSGEILMGVEPAFTLSSGNAAKIATGGMLPEGADSVLMLEFCQEAGDTLEVQKALAPGDNVIQSGEDISKGQVLLERGARVRPQDAAAMAALGITGLEVYARPKVSVISTGDEIVPPEKRLAPGLVRDSNSYLLRGMILDEGCDPVFRGIFRDDLEAIRAEVVRCSAETDAVLISGGSSVGTKDMAEKVLKDLGRIVFHSVALRPGKPLLFGVIEGRPVFGLPGHPRAVQVCFDLFVRPALRRISGLSASRDMFLGKTVKARLSKSINSPLGRQDVVPVRLERRDDALWAMPLLGRSGLLTSIVRAHGSFHVPVGTPGYEKGELVDVRID